MIPANLLGLAAAVVGMLIGSLAPTLIASKGHSIEAALGQQAGHHGSSHPHKS
jgi:hypothetical protein